MRRSYCFTSHKWSAKWIGLVKLSLHYCFTHITSETSVSIICHNISWYSEKYKSTVIGQSIGFLTIRDHLYGKYSTDIRSGLRRLKHSNLITNAELSGVERKFVETFSLRILLVFSAFIFPQTEMKVRERKVWNTKYILPIHGIKHTVEDYRLCHSLKFYFQRLWDWNVNSLLMWINELSRQRQLKNTLFTSPQHSCVLFFSDSDVCDHGGARMGFTTLRMAPNGSLEEVRSRKTHTTKYKLQKST